jgi:hypothetical protein
MSPGTRTRYFSLWLAACKVKGWDSKDDGLRRATVLSCMAQVRGPAVTTSDPDFGPDEITALFVFLDHLAHPSDLLKSAAWVDCQTDYRAYNRARQADWHPLAGQNVATPIPTREAQPCIMPDDFDPANPFG